MMFKEILLVSNLIVFSGVFLTRNIENDKAIKSIVSNASLLLAISWIVYIIKDLAS